jgi:hypothetical protein
MKMPRRISNTTQIAHDNPDVAVHMGIPAAIEASERAGQQEFVASEMLPVDTHGGDAAFLALGFTFGAPDVIDPIFRPATLPEGWTREASDHARWSYLVDRHAVQRVAVFYKAAFYDRSAWMHVIGGGTRA